MFDVIVAADLDWGIGKAGGLPWPKLRGDLQHFKRVTSAATAGMRAAVVMGRKTWQSAEIAGRPLPKRLNVVVSRGALAVPDGVAIAHSIDAALRVATDAKDVETVFVCGGAEIYRAAIARPDLRWIYLTRVDGRFDCEVKIPDLDRDFRRASWDGDQALEENGVRYRIERLQRR